MISASFKEKRSPLLSTVCTLLCFVIKLLKLLANMYIKPALTCTSKWLWLAFFFPLPRMRITEGSMNMISIINISSAGSLVVSEAVRPPLDSVKDSRSAVIARFSQ